MYFFKLILVIVFRLQLELEITEAELSSWSLFEMKIDKRYYAELIQLVISIGTY